MYLYHSSLSVFMTNKTQKHHNSTNLKVTNGLNIVFVVVLLLHPHHYHHHYLVWPLAVHTLIHNLCQAPVVNL